MSNLVFITAVLLSGSLTAAQEKYISNFQVVHPNNTHITLSWSTADRFHRGMCSNGGCSFCYRHLYSASPKCSVINNNQITRKGTKFTYTANVKTLHLSGEYTMSIRVRGPCPRSMNTVSNMLCLAANNFTYSGKQYVKINQVENVLEFKVHLWPSETCSDFDGKSTSVATAVYWLIVKTCECTLPHDFIVDGYFTCYSAESGYAIYRAKLTTAENAALFLTSLKDNLNKYLTEQDRHVMLNISGKGYIVEPGPCGLTVSHLDSPHCFNDFEEDAPQDNTVIIVVPTVCGTLVAIGVLIVGLVFIVRKKQKIIYRPVPANDVGEVIRNDPQGPPDVENASVHTDLEFSLPPGPITRPQNSSTDNNAAEVNEYDTERPFLPDADNSGFTAERTTHQQHSSTDNLLEGFDHGGYGSTCL